jgi:hypothetical protein
LCNAVRASRQSLLLPGREAEYGRLAMNGFGADKNGGFNGFSEAYKKDPSIENYVKLLRESPDAEIDIAVFGGMEPLLYAA